MEATLFTPLLRGGEQLGSIRAKRACYESQIRDDAKGPEWRARVLLLFLSVHALVSFFVCFLLFFLLALFFWLARSLSVCRSVYAARRKNDSVAQTVFFI